MDLRRALIFAAACLAFGVVALGAYVRLSDAGLGCPDWPGCYGRISPHHAADDIAAAQAAEPLGPVSMPKAWKEMTHRYLATTLGLLILGLAILAWRRRQLDRSTRVGLPLAIAGVVVLQGLLGKWTVTLLLKPAIVSLHLLGGLSVLALLTWLLLREHGVPRPGAPKGLVGAARIALVLVVAQIALGGWVSTNYAALACMDFPSCQAAWVPQMRFAEAFHLLHELGMRADGEHLSLAALTAIHWTHRLGALIVGTYLLVFGLQLARHPVHRPMGLLLLTAVSVQIGLGIANVMLKLPLHVAVAHNAGAVVLTLAVVSLNYRLRTSPASQRAERRLDESLAT